MVKSAAVVSVDESALSAKKVFALRTAPVFHLMTVTPAKAKGGGLDVAFRTGGSQFHMGGGQFHEEKATAPSLPITSLSTKA